jgi:hypothetical protein
MWTDNASSSHNGDAVANRRTIPVMITRRTATRPVDLGIGMGP